MRSQFRHGDCVVDVKNSRIRINGFLDLLRHRDRHWTLDRRIVEKCTIWIWNLENSPK